MDYLISLFYIVFCICVIYPPTEFVTAGFTIPQVFEYYLGSENTNFIAYHMKRITITQFVHASLPFGYIISLWISGFRNPWMPFMTILTAIIPVAVSYRFVSWWEYDKSKHPVVRPLVKYARPGTDWRMVAADLNVEFHNVDKVSIELSTTSKFIATATWLIKVTQYKVFIMNQTDCSLVVTATDVHNLAPTGENEIQYVNIEAIPNQIDVERFSIRISAMALQELQPRLRSQVRVPEHLSLLPSLIERFVTVFKQYVDQNPVYLADQEIELCIGCMSNPSDVKIKRRCISPPPQLEGGPQQCEQCNCRVLWCCSCMGRWWAARARGPPSHWLAGRCTCPVCRARFCMLDICPARPANTD
ncbi:hypothetical protein ACJJTC_011480 [Scirpophaga incertulas]